MENKINNITDLVKILADAESNANDVKEVRVVVGYTDGSDKTLAEFIANGNKSFEDELTKVRAELKDINAEYVKSQCDKTHVMVERDELKQLRDDVENAIYQVTNSSEEIQSAKCSAEEAEYQSDEAGASLRSVEGDLEIMSSLNLPKEEDKNLLDAIDKDLNK